MQTNLLLRQQLDDKLKAFNGLEKLSVPPTGWIKAIRLALGISLEQLGKKLAITKQSTRSLEEREKEGSITLQTLRDVANALDMQLVYGFVPKDGSLNDLIDRKAKKLATEIVLRTSTSMKLEDQENSKERIEKAIEERTREIKTQMPKSLWD